MKTNELISGNLRKVPRGLVPPPSLSIIGGLLLAANLTRPHDAGVTVGSMVQVAEANGVPDCPGLTKAHCSLSLVPEGGGSKHPLQV